MKVFKLLMLNFFICCLFSGIAQNISLENYSVEEGLPSPEVYDVIQDDYGYLWFATDHGLSRYNGYEFENYGLKDGITNTTVFGFFRQKNGKIWCNTFDHTLFTITGADPVFTPYKYNEELKKRLTDKWVEHEVYIDDSDAVYLSYSHRLGYMKIDSNGHVFDHRDKEKQLFNTDNLYIQMFVDKGRKQFTFLSMQEKFDTNVQIASPKLQGCDYCRAEFLAIHNTSIYTYGSHVLFWNEKDGINKKMSFSNRPVAMGKFDESHVWISFRFGGVGIYDYLGNKINHLLPDKYVTSMYQDHQGIIWVSTLSTGIFKLKNLGVVTVFSKKKMEWVNSIATDSQGNIYTGGYLGDVAKVKKDSLISFYEPSEKFPARIKYKNGQLKFNSIHGIYSYDGKKVKQLIQTSVARWGTYHNDTLVIFWYNAIKLLHNGKIIKQISNDIRVGDICSVNDTLYFATKHGLFFLNEKADQLLPVKQLHPFFSYRIDALVCRKKELLMGSRGYGLGIYRNGKLTVIDQSKGLTSDYISKVVVENDSTIWVCTNAGLNLVQFSGSAYAIQQFTFNDGLPSNQTYDVLIADDTVWVATRKGLCFFNKSLLDKKKTANVNYYLRLLNVKVNDTLREVNRSLNLDYHENRVEFNFQGISFKNNQPLVYRYKMEGLEDDWTYTSSRRAIYSSVLPGSYYFIVQVNNGAKTEKWEQHQIVLPINIAPPYWDTWPFKLTMVSLLGLLVYLFFRYNILSYNRDITRELLRHLLKRIKRKASYLVIKEKGKEIKIDTSAILYVKSEGNYLDIYTEKEKFVIRCKIGEFLDLVPDPIEFLRIHRSYIIRLDKVEQKEKREVVCKGHSIPVGKTYLKAIKNIQL